MQVIYQVLDEDMEAAGRYLVAHDEGIRKDRRRARLAGLLTVLVGGALAVGFDPFPAWPAYLIFVVAAALYAAAIGPLYNWLVMRRIHKQHVESSDGKPVVTLLETREEGLYYEQGKAYGLLPYEMLSRLSSDDTHDFISMGKRSAMPVPYRAFETDAARRAFHDELAAHITQGKTEK